MPPMYVYAQQEVDVRVMSAISWIVEVEVLVSGLMRSDLETSFEYR